nr:nucleotide kinase domain-containing protein [Geomonas sp. Red32]
MPAIPTIVYDTYWRFANERQAIFFARQKASLPPWTSDPILRVHKFTNCYRASDRVSQYLIRHVIYSGSQKPAEIFFRTLLFKLFNRIETWELLTKNFGQVTYADYSFDQYDAVLTTAIEAGARIYSAAYIMPSGGPASPYSRKHRMHLALLEQMMKDELYNKVADCQSLSGAFALLRSYPTIGDFLAYQFVIDLNYSDLLSFEENDFVVPGPGARDGIRKCFSNLGGLDEADIIRMVTERQHVEFERLGLPFKSLWGRPLQLIDCQNIFCEVDKYARIRHPEVIGVTGRQKIKQKFKPLSKPIAYWYPPKWGLNHKIESGIIP